MKNAINYYYNLYPENIHQTKKGYYFTVNKTRYFLTKYLEEPKDIQKIYSMHLNLLNQNFYVHPIVLNTQNQIITTIDNEPYILMITIYYKEKITLNDIIYFLKSVKTSADPPNWGELWAKKNDYLEYQMSMLGQKHPLLRESFSYYIGLGETAIQLVNSLTKTSTPLVYAHKRLTQESRQYDLYNPLNLTIDYSVRDIAEYLKNSFFCGKNIEEDLKTYLNSASLTYYEYLLFLARLIYPTYYFDLYEEIITDRQNDNEIKKITDKTDEFEKIIKKVYHYYKSFMPTPRIDWLE